MCFDRGKLEAETHTPRNVRPNGWIPESGGQRLGATCLSQWQVLSATAEANPAIAATIPAGRNRDHERTWRARTGVAAFTDQLDLLRDQRTLDHHQMRAEQQRNAIAALFAATGAVFILGFLSIALSSPAGAADVALASPTSAQVTPERPGAPPKLPNSAGTIEGPNTPLFNGFDSFAPGALSDLLTPQSATSQRLESQNDAAISGVIRGPGGAPLAPGTSGEVTLYDADNRYPWNPSKSGAFSSDGYYYIGWITPGDYKAVVEPTNNYPPAFWRDAQAMSSGNVLSLKPGDYKAGVDQDLQVGGVIQGTVRTPDGAPFDCCVNVIVYNLSGDRIASNYPLRSDYQVRVPPGTYKVTFEPGGWYPQSWWPNAYGPLAAEPVTVAAGQTVQIDQVLLPPDPANSSISGQVLDPSGQPITDLDGGVSVTDVDGLHVASGWLDQGTFRVSNLPYGDYYVDVAPSSSIYAATYWQDATVMKEAKLVSLSPASSSVDLSMRLQLATSISGTIRGPHGSALTPGDTGRVMLTTKIDDFIEYYEETNWTVGQDGSAQYSIRNLNAATTYERFVPDNKNLSIMWWKDTPAQGSALPIPVSAKTPAQTLDMNLQLAGSISGKPIVPADSGCRYAVTAFDKDGNAVTPESSFNADDPFTLSQLAVGDYTLHFEFSQCGGVADMWWEAGNTRQSATPVHVTAGADTGGINPVAQLGAGVDVNLTGPGGEPVVQSPGVLQLIDTSGAIIDTTEAENGWNSLFALAGTYKLKFAPFGNMYAAQWYSSATTIEQATPIDVDPGSTADVTMQLESNVPGPVHDLRATPGNGQATLTWTAPSPGTSPITGYEIDSYDHIAPYYEDWRPRQQVPPSDVAATVSSLRNGTAYSFRIAAQNADGQGPWTEVSVTPDGPIPDPEPTPTPTPTPTPAPPTPDPTPDPTPTPTPTPRTVQMVKGAVVKRLKINRTASLRKKTNVGSTVKWKTLTPRYCKIGTYELRAQRKPGKCKITAQAPPKGTAERMPPTTYIVKIVR